MRILIDAGGEKHLKGPHKRTAQQDMDFDNNLRILINENIDCA